MNASPVGVDLRTYLDSAGRGAGTQLARALGVSPVMVTQWADDHSRKRIPVERAVAVEVATGGAVRRWNSRPLDWHLHWPELIGSDGAPPVPPRAPINDAQDEPRGPIVKLSEAPSAAERRAPGSDRRTHESLLVIEPDHRRSQRREVDLLRASKEDIA